MLARTSRGKGEGRATPGRAGRGPGSRRQRPARPGGIPPPPACLPAARPESPGALRLRGRQADCPGAREGPAERRRLGVYEHPRAPRPRWRAGAGTWETGRGGGAQAAPRGR